jgi:hypothetical protein
MGRWLSLAAAPTFAAMALLSGLPGGGAMADRLCVSPPDGWRWNAMVQMYLLMSAVHLGPWVKALARGTSGRAPL